MVPGPPSSVWLFSRGALTALNQLCPWRDSPSLLAVSSRWLPRPAISSESLADQEWGLPSHWGACPLPAGLLLPGYLGPQIRLWRRCYLRGRPEVQVRREDRDWEWEKGLTAEPDVIGETRCFRRNQMFPGAGKARGWGNWEVKNHSCWYQSG